MGKTSAGWTRIVPPHQSLADAVVEKSLWLILIIGVDRLRDAQPQIAEFQPLGLSGDSQNTNRFVLTSAGEHKDQGEQESIQLYMRLRVQVIRIGIHALLDECPKIKVETGGRGAFNRVGGKLGKESGKQY